MLSPKKNAEKMPSNSPEYQFFKFGYLPHSFHRQCALNSLRTITFIGTTYIHKHTLDTPVTVINLDSIPITNTVWFHIILGVQTKLKSEIGTPGSKSKQLLFNISHHDA